MIVTSIAPCSVALWPILMEREVSRGRGRKEWPDVLCGSVADIDGKGSGSGQGKEGVAWPDVLCGSVADIDGKGSKSGQGKEGMA